MIKLNAKKDNVEVAITGDAVDIARELHALLECIKDNEYMQVALMTAIAVGKASEEERNEKSNWMTEMLNRASGKGNNNEKFKS